MSEIPGAYYCAGFRCSSCIAYEAITFRSSLSPMRGGGRNTGERVERRFRWFEKRPPVSARELLIEFQNMAPTAFQERGVSLEDILTSPEAGVAFMRSMPSTDVSMALKTAWHRNRDKPWSANDIYDIDPMALAVPYCDVVVTEKACHHALVSTGMGARMDTVLLRDLPSLVSTLKNWRGA